MLLKNMKTLLIMAVVLSAVLDLLLPIEWVSMIFLSLEAVDATMRVFRYAAASTIPFLLIGVCRFFSVGRLENIFFLRWRTKTCLRGSCAAWKRKRLCTTSKTILAWS
ncbi:hypothetical protein Pcac1_g9463 [Phytophthora cactorum]|nr:hypothetical protein Pcac1_g9463 [Phytophthora cactorum]KAG2824987.1 hypothetical protein PC112_g9880 [Phytophthora cactorum]KAG2827154.1 hypothetical protein PC111_g8687 [Phytophthora cactorum]KAG2907706.1 hypothetical protein PC114_g10745 [Phytophthora cactorum]KAG3082904.1 hypothetical protein PC121_g5900 [Phytophthora cactorum]